MYKQNAWKKYDDVAPVMEFCEDYKVYLSNSKTERLATKNAKDLAIKAGFKDLADCESVKEGDKVFAINKDKNIVLFVIGKKCLCDGLRILGAHIDSPRLDVKQNPVYESNGFALLDTHYYGGVKKYQWVTVPLSLVGVVCKKDGTKIDVCIGEDDNDPVLGITDLLIHLSGDQLSKPAAKVIEGESLDVSLGSMPLKDSQKDAVKANVLKILKDKYDFEEEDFISAEIEVVPSGKVRDYGLDRSMLMGYGHDDRVCAYTSLRAILDLKDVPEYTSCCILVDKEEIGSVGATGMQSKFFENTLAELMDKYNGYKEISFRKMITNSKMLSSDVSAGFDPLFAGVNEPKNSAYLGNGLCFNKYTGSRGKSGCNDAMPEFFAEIRNQLDNANVYYQTAELGRVDQGGGGTIAYILGNMNMYVIDAGIAVLNMHAPWEVVSKVDVYEAYLGYLAFLDLK